MEHKQIEGIEEKSEEGRNTDILNNTQFFPHSPEHSSKPFNWFKHTWLKSFYMIGSFWNLCRACPSMPVDKVIIITFMFIYIFMIAHSTFHYTTNFGPTLLNSYSRQKLNTHTQKTARICRLAYWSSLFYSWQLKKKNQF